VAGNEVSALRLGKVVKKVFDLRGFHGGRIFISARIVQRSAEFLRHVRHGQAASPLNFVKSFQKIAGVLVVLLVIAGAVFITSEKPTTPPSAFGQSVLTQPVQHLLHAQPKLPTMKVFISDGTNSQEFTAEICDEPVEIATGMMFRTRMAENEAMLFVFDRPEPRNFYMRNCIVPLSAAYIEPDGRIAEIVELNPGDERGVASRSLNIQFVLEVPQGWFKRNNLGAGAMIRTEHGALKETFFKK
jgi:uncharacterized membrane protein (UPF0127 family)